MSNNATFFFIDLCAHQVNKQAHVTMALWCHCRCLWCRGRKWKQMKLEYYKQFVQIYHDFNHMSYLPGEKKIDSKLENCNESELLFPLHLQREIKKNVSFWWRKSKCCYCFFYFGSFQYDMCQQNEELFTLFFYFHQN